MRKFAITAASVALAATMVIGFSSSIALAAKVDCDAVMSELNGGKKAKEVAADMKISVSSVYRCKRHAAAAAKASTKTTTAVGTKGSAAASAAPSPSTH